MPVELEDLPIPTAHELGNPTQATPMHPPTAASPAAESLSTSLPVEESQLPAAKK